MSEGILLVRVVSFPALLTGAVENNWATFQDGTSKAAFSPFFRAHVVPIRSARKTRESLFETSHAISGLAERTFLNRPLGLVTKGKLEKYGV